MKNLSNWILKTAGWNLISTIEVPDKSVICVAPHTSNWDFVIGKLSYWAMGRKAGFLMKKSWFFFPFNYIFKAMGGIPVDRSKRSSVTQEMVDEFRKRETFHLAITPEGTRSPNAEWKMGFYYIALKAGVPIQLAYLDYKKKEMGITELFLPTGNENEDILTIKAFYRNITPKFPERFQI